jgi:hypothetical protein
LSINDGGDEMTSSTTSITLTRKDDRLLLSAPYHPDLASRAKTLGGRWIPASAVWAFDPRDEVRVRGLCETVFGIDPNGAPPDLVDVRFRFHGRIDMQSLWLCGREVASRRGRDEAVRLGADVIVEEGSFTPSGGSVKFPWLGDVDGVALLVRDVPRPLAERLTSRELPPYLRGTEIEFIEPDAARAELRDRLGAEAAAAAQAAN